MSLTSHHVISSLRYTYLPHSTAPLSSSVLGKAATQPSPALETHSHASAYTDQDCIHVHAQTFVPMQATCMQAIELHTHFFLFPLSVVVG